MKLGDERPRKAHGGESPRSAGSRRGDPLAGRAPSASEPPEPFTETLSETFESAPIGEYLRRQRVLREMSIDELSTMTRIPLRSLERLEGGEFDGETDGFVRGFVRTVAIALGLDVDDAVSRMLQEPAPGAWERHSSNRKLKQSVAVVGGLIVLGLGLLVLRAGWGLLVGASSDAPGREVVMWRDPVRALADEMGVEVDPAQEIDPAEGSRTPPSLAESAALDRR